MHPYDFIFAGLALDLVGAVVLGKGFMFKNPQASYFESLMIFDGNPHILKSSLVQRAEAQIGAGLLVLGFLFQIWGNLHGGIAAAEPGWVNSLERMLLVLVVVVLATIIVMYLATLNARAKFYRIFFRNFSVDAALQPPSNDATWYERLSLILDLRRLRRGESDADFLLRLETRRLELGRQYGGQARNIVVND